MGKGMRAKPAKSAKMLYTMDEVVAMFELYKTGLYGRLADVYKFKQEQVQDLDLFAMRMSQGIQNRDYALKDLSKNALKHGVDIPAVFRHTNHVLHSAAGKEQKARVL